jgi:CheY-like chemotaxis protein
MKVLMIDDSLMQQKIARIYLEKGEGYIFFTANNGKQGFDIARIELPDLILLDVEMPVMNGEETLKILKADPETREIPVVMCTAIEDTCLLEKLIAMGASAYIKKPHGFSTLKNIIKDIVKIH